MRFLLILSMALMMSIIVGVLGELLVRNIFIVGISTLIVWIFATLKIFDKTLIAWAIANTIVTIIGAMLCRLYRKQVVKRNRC